eukprot:450755-Pelagomonas_calceolata.AAC.4
MLEKWVAGGWLGASTLEVSPTGGPPSPKLSLCVYTQRMRISCVKTRAAAPRPAYDPNLLAVSTKRIVAIIIIIIIIIAIIIIIIIIIIAVAVTITMCAAQVFARMEAYLEALLEATQVSFGAHFKSSTARPYLSSTRMIAISQERAALPAQQPLNCSLAF